MRTQALSEALEQQTATSEVLKVISSSPGELQPVFEAMLANAVRICDASFGVLFRIEDGAMHAAAMFGVPRHLLTFGSAALSGPVHELPLVGSSKLSRRSISLTLKRSPLMSTARRSFPLPLISEASAHL